MKANEKETKQHVIDYVWDCVYNANGFTFSDYYNEYFGGESTFRASQHGERFYEVVEHEDCDPAWVEIPVDYSEYRSDVSYYFGPFITEWKKQRFPINSDLMIDVFMWKLCHMQIYQYYEVDMPTPKKIKKFADKFLFC